MQVRLNLATKPAELHRKFLFGASIVGIAALAAFVLLAVHAYRGWRADHDLRTEIASYEGDLRGLAEQRREIQEFLNRPATQAKRERAAFLNNLIAQRSFPWTRIFMDLEKILPSGVRVVSIAPVMKEGRIELKLVVGALSDQAKLKFLQALDESREFSRFQVVKEQRNTRQNDEDQVLIELVAWYATT